jgi:3-hydroxy-9,10-secoandrosta-1,3,5(10)-triene-9,17-dione monooxygenase reductase component
MADRPLGAELSQAHTRNNLRDDAGPRDSTLGDEHMVAAVEPEFPPRELGADELRQALGRFVTGVTIVTCRDENGQAVGLTANSFNALSLSPPLVLWSLREASASIAAFTRATHFAVNVLSADQVELSRRFARPSSAKFDEGEWSDGQGGAPLLAGCVAVFECRRRSHHAAGDHVLFIGEVERIGGSASTPLVYHAGHYRTLCE